ncbi:hypothetical protein SXCC_00674 [Gluconacetobacter sp. SXCC-1]|nr:hypothetical protein SXCC_00674 [Gluconacetobacter sp. SXCC-1]
MAMPVVAMGEGDDRLCAQALSAMGKRKMSRECFMSFSG